ncbi:hypothetical protein BHU72_07110 [Desulfuribacillus stibiiarsenatis]|uniref:Ktr system potassium uptake protein D n=1 Tax=Desulfuribacillus stibiiarsenatis TaxID=1390249 RepID=A0A1E5L4G8_9FIRM|nr:potassium transporter TrkG [Desulfuribacillus stibiiarsenatis]OEH84954.1 hypothetical protein BHU72_07110 [Desulfuribacillus stibiiarsenatis]
MKLTKLVHHISPVHMLVLIYVAATVLASILLSLPWSIKPGVDFDLLEILFTAISAISVTGLSVVSTADTFTPFGIVMLAIILQFGGIGMMTAWTLVWILLGRKIGLGYRQLIMFDQNRTDMIGLVRVIRYVFGFSILFELIGFIYFSGLLYVRGYYDTVLQSMYYGAFHAISSYTNAGFDIFGDSLLGYYHDYLFQLGTMVLIILGSIGFPVLIETWSYLQAKKLKQRYRFSLFTKITVTTFFLLIMIGAAVMFTFEYNGFFKDAPLHEKLMASLFSSVTARNAGLATLDFANFYIPTLLILSALMFIGASPSSVGGGIRTTTFAIVFLAIRNYALGRTDVQVFGRRINERDVIKSFVVFTTGVAIVIGAIIVIDALEMHRHSLAEVIFEVSSAFGTTGLSTGITAELTSASKIIIMWLMFIGRIGILSFLLGMRFNNEPIPYRYPEEKMIIG